MQGRICRKCTSKRREQARQPIFAQDKTSGGDGMEAATWNVRTDIKGKRLEKQGLLKGLVSIYIRITADFKPTFLCNLQPVK